jgi:uncharacterized protein involved in exopolysaccharide biosynthesis
METEISAESNEAMVRVAAIKALTHLAKHKKLVASLVGSAILVGVVYSLLLPTEYTSVAKIMPPRQTQSTTSLLNNMPGGGSLADMASGGLSLRDPNAIYIGLLKSRPIADTIIDQYHLQAVYRVKDMTSARVALDKATDVASERSGLISISARDHDRRRASDIANAYIAQLRVLTKSISVTEASKRRLFFEEQLKQANEDLVASELAFQQFQQSKGLIRLDAQAGTIVGDIASIRGQIAAKEVELQVLRSYSTERNSDVQIEEREVSALQEKAAQLEHGGGESDFSEMGLKDLPKAGLDFVRAQRDLQYRQAFYDLLLKQFEAAKLDEGKEAAVIQVVEPAIPPDARSSPHRGLIVQGFAVAGFLIACIFLYLRNFLQTDPKIARLTAELQEALMRI